MGYAGGTTAAPTYRRMGDHTETLQIDFDPARLSFLEVMRLFWRSPRVERPAFSRQYMAAVFASDEEQRRIALQARSEREAELGQPVHAPVLPLRELTVAEDYHQKYYLRGADELMRAFERYGPAQLRESTIAARLNAIASGHGFDPHLDSELEGFGLPAPVVQSARGLLSRRP